MGYMTGYRDSVVEIDLLHGQLEDVPAVFLIHGDFVSDDSEPRGRWEIEATLFSVQLGGLELDRAQVLSLVGYSQLCKLDQLASEEFTIAENDADTFTGDDDYAPTACELVHHMHPVYALDNV